MRDVFGPGTVRATSLRLAARDYRRRQRRAMVMRAFLVVTLAASFFSSVALMSGKGPSSGAVATRAAPFDLDPVTTGSVTKPARLQPPTR
ncbi:MAG TPA: hypothetical protein VHN20_15805 [Beijerinckiaceae bacterium]|nr:hypothetical protein [Beijerinckiaceae bacterium]